MQLYVQYNVGMCNTIHRTSQNSKWLDRAVKYQARGTKKSHMGAYWTGHYLLNLSCSFIHLQQLLYRGQNHCGLITYYLIFWQTDPSKIIKKNLTQVQIKITVSKGRD